MRSLILPSLLALSLVACSSSEDGDDSSAKGGAQAAGHGGSGQGGKSAASGASGQGGQAAGGKGGSAQAGSGGSKAGQGGSAGAQAGGSAQAGSAQAGQGGSAQAGSAQAGSSQAGSGGSSQAGSGGSSQAGSDGSPQAGSGGSAQAGSGASGEGGAQAAGSGGAGPAGGGGQSAGGSGGSGAGGKGPAYEAGTAACPADDGVRRIKLVNNCSSARWFKMDGRTTPLWARPAGCAWEGKGCGQPDGVEECTKIAHDLTSDDPGLVYCKAKPEGGAACACNPFFELKPGEQHTIELPADAAFPSGTGWLAVDCNAHGAACQLGNEPARNSVFEFTYDAPGKGALYYDISAVNAWTSVSAVGMKACGEAPDPNNVFWCRGTGCRFDVATQCPDGSGAFAPGPAGCQECPTKVENGKKVLAGSCGTCPDGHSGNKIPGGTVFNANNIGGNEWTWSGDPAFAQGFGHDEGAHANRRFACGPAGCQPAQGAGANTCLGGCDLCTLTQGQGPADPACIKYCCPDMTVNYGGASYRYDSAGCTALGVQAGTDYSPALKGECPYVYTYGYEDHSSTFQCATTASLLIEACPDAVDFPSSL